MIIVGLGNPGLKYAKTRHNTGYMFVDYVAMANKATFKMDKDLQCMKAEIVIKGEKHWLIKPITYMNSSGNCVRAVKDYYKVDISQILVIYDDKDLDIGVVRIRKCGSSGGHNGIKSIISSLGTESFSRIRIGIGPNNIEMIDFVLSKFNKNEKVIIDNIISTAPNMVDDYVNHGIDYIMNHYNG